MAVDIQPRRLRASGELPVQVSSPPGHPPHDTQWGTLLWWEVCALERGGNLVLAVGHFGVVTLRTPPFPVLHGR